METFSIVMTPRQLQHSTNHCSVCVCNSWLDFITVKNNPEYIVVLLWYQKKEFCHHNNIRPCMIQTHSSDLQCCFVAATNYERYEALFYTLTDHIRLLSQRHEQHLNEDNVKKNMQDFWLKEQKKKSKERRDRWIKKTKKSKSVWGTYAGTKTAERSIFCARRCKYKTWPLLQTRQSQSSSLQPTAHPAHSLSVCTAFVFLISVSAWIRTLLRLYLTCTFITDEPKPPVRNLTWQRSRSSWCAGRARVRSADSALYLKPNTSLCLLQVLSPTPLTPPLLSSVV